MCVDLIAVGSRERRRVVTAKRSIGAGTACGDRAEHDDVQS
jgi:hypothetical protein